MRKATRIDDLLMNFYPEPLSGSELNDFYCEDMMQLRTGDPSFSPIDNILYECQIPQEHNAFLLMGHRGCGKSTELNRMAVTLKDKGYAVEAVACGKDLDLLDLESSDLLILMGETLVRMADKVGCSPNKKLIEKLEKFWGDFEHEETEEAGDSIEAESSISASIPTLLQLIKLSAGVKTKLKTDKQTKATYRKEIIKRTSDWLRLITELSEEITGKLDGKQPILIFEDLDKLDPEIAWKVFLYNASVLSSLPIPVIYTFPIALSYDTRFPALSDYFKDEFLPMIKIETPEGIAYEDGINSIRRLVGKRANQDLFEPEALNEMIRLTGGSLRDLFRVIIDAGARARTRQSLQINMEDAQQALMRLETELTRRIEQKDYPFLAEICNGQKELVSDKLHLLTMMQASVVLEYNGERWHNVHPLVSRFLSRHNQLGI